MVSLNVSLDMTIAVDWDINHKPNKHKLQIKKLKLKPAA